MIAAKKLLFINSICILSIFGKGLYAQQFNEQTDIYLPGVHNSSSAFGDYDNDGDLDILLTGYAGSTYGYISRVYKNNGDNSFTWQSNFVLTGVRYSSVAWGDYNNDEYLDILLTGYTGSDTISKVYKNIEGESFIEQTDISLTGVTSGSVDWGDYNNDGYLDILLTGYIGSDKK